MRGDATITVRRLLYFGFAALALPLRDSLELAGWQIVCVRDIRSATRALHSQKFGVGLIVAEHWTETQCEAVRAFLHGHRHTEWVGLLSVEAQQVGGCRDLILGYLFDHHTLPVDARDLLGTLGHAHGRYALGQRQSFDARADFLAGGGPTSMPVSSHLRPANSDGEHGRQSIIGQSHAVQVLLRQLSKIAATEAPVLIGGESGTGKELAAQAIHLYSRRCEAPFIAVNCGALTATLIQAELFGAKRGAFTGAIQDRTGLLKAADGGTIFLDEIADLPLDMQINLLRFLQEQTFTQVGATSSTHVDVRVVAAANVDLACAVQQGRFRHDLFYRLNVLPITVPPLRQRRDDIVLLAEHFFQHYAADRNGRLRGFAASARRAMLTHDWPGNVRELINRVRRALVMSEGRLIQPHDLGLVELGTSAEQVDQVRLDAERVAVCAALSRSHHNVTYAARELGVSRMTLYRMMQRHHLDRGEPTAAQSVIPISRIKKHAIAKT